MSAWSPEGGHIHLQETSLQGIIPDLMLALEAIARDILDWRVIEDHTGSDYYVLSTVCPESNQPGERLCH